MSSSSHVPSLAADCKPPGRSPARPRGLRQQSKARSRGRLLEAARRLFIEHGYEAATVRGIAAAAGLSTGAVFASFTDKADLFAQVMAADGQALVEAMRRAAPQAGPVQVRLLALLSAAADYQLLQPQLLRAVEGVSWSQGLAGPQGHAAIEMLLQALKDAAASGELKPDAELGLIAETLWDCCLANLHRALSAGGDLAQLAPRIERQIGLLLAGQRTD